jgi:hypothetical protein
VQDLLTERTFLLAAMLLTVALIALISAARERR